MDFKQWINDLHLENIVGNVRAFCFNLYESCEDEKFDAQLVGCERYDENNDDWACKVIYSSEENLYSFNSEDWEHALVDFSHIVRQYLQQCEGSEKLKKAEYVAVGFVDGDLELIVKDNCLII